MEDYHRVIHMQIDATDRGPSASKGCLDEAKAFFDDLPVLDIAPELLEMDDRQIRVARLADRDLME